ncbi:MAG TPA: protein kinase, partial [Phototrophicaceae bacterium]|nr:protein kinase [Phototrophicaceae bacterium]
AYISPEQIRGELLTPQTDIYMFGTLLYEMLVGTHPYPEATSAALLYKHLSEPVPNLFEVNPDLPLALNNVIQRATAKDPAGRYKDVLDLVSDYRRALRVSRVSLEEIDDSDDRIITGSTLTLPEPENPYKGLRAFQQADAADFFGRESLTARLIDRLNENVPHSRFLAVVGPSGSGKSSVVKAGLIPALQRGEIEGSDKWFIVEMVPGIEPMEELEATLLRVAVNPPDSLLTQLNEDERGFLRAVKRVLPGDDSELLLFIDQFEELYTLVEDEEVRARFMDSLIVAVTDPRSQIRVVITLRADFYDRPLNYVRFGELIQQRTEVVLPLTTDEIEAAVSRPAERSGLQLERGLVTAIVADVKEQPGALPLLQYALTELYERRNGRALVLHAYHEIGGTMGALARRADELFAGLGKDGQEAARQMFLRLVTLGEGTEDTRRRALQSELLELGKNRGMMEMALDAFGRYRLLTFDNDPQTRQSTVEVAHEALIRQWSRLRDWLNTSRDDLRSQRRVTGLTQDWLESGKDSGYLARGNRLDQLETWYKNTTLALTENERNYMEAALALREKELTAEQERQRRENELEQRSRNRLRALVAVLAVAALVASILSVFAVSQNLAAQAAQKDADAARLAAEDSADEAGALALAANARSALTENDPMLSIALAHAASDAYQPAPVEVVRVLANAVYAPGIRFHMTGHTGAVVNVAYALDGSSVASVSSDSTLKLWDAATGAERWSAELPDQVITSVAFSPDGKTLLTGSTDHIAHLWNVADGKILREFGGDTTGHTDTITSVAFSPDGSQILTGSLDRTALIWDVNTGEIVKRFDDTLDSEFPPGAITVVAFNSDATKAVIGTVDETIANVTDDRVDRTVRVWDLVTGQQVVRIEPKSGFIRTATISPDSSTIVVGTWDGTNNGTLRLYSATTGEEIRRIYGHTDVITGVAYSPDGKRLLSSSWDGSLRLWDVNTGVEVRRFTGFGDRLLDFAFSANGQYVIVGTGNLGNNDILKERERSKNAAVWLIDLQNRATMRTFTGHTDWVWESDISADGQFVVSGSGPLRPPAKDTTVRIWNIATGETLQTMQGHTDTVDGVAFAPDGKTVLSGGWDSLIILWDAATGQEIRRFTGHTGHVTAVDISPDNKLGISSDNSGNIILWDLATGQEVRRMQIDFPADMADSDKEISDVRFNKDGTKALAGLLDGTIRLFDTATGEQIRVYTGHTDQVNKVAFSPDEQFIASASWDSTVRLWNTETGEQVRQFTGHTGAV